MNENKLNMKPLLLLKESAFIKSLKQRIILRHNNKQRTTPNKENMKRNYNYLNMK